ncbi:MAG: glycosyltransferase [Betaproteobacteria bacterium]
MIVSSTTRPRVTIVMSIRERHALSEAAIDSIVADTPAPYRFLYLDVQSPPWLCETLERRAGEWNLEVVRFDEPLWPQEARVRILGEIDTDFAVFIDNDVQVEPSWLEALVRCADETGAGIVGPLYLWGDGIGRPMIHMAGGKLAEALAEGGRVLDESHYLMNVDPRQAADELVRRSCDFVEYHCMLVRTALLQDDTVMDPRLRAVHEHIDIALASIERGLPVYFEPASRVQYLAFATHMLDDLDFLRKRWDRDEAEANIALFCAKWGVVNDERSFGGVREFLGEHVARVDPLRPAGTLFRDRDVAVRRDELRQTRSDLLDLARERGYDAIDLANIDDAFLLAQQLMNGIDRPCGRPFLNHLAGVASVLVRYGFRADTIAAGLLHSAYSHSPLGAHGPDAEKGNEGVCARLGGPDSAVEQRVRAYSHRESIWSALDEDPAALSTLSVFEAEVIALAAANEVEMHLSGEVRNSGRTDTMDGTVLSIAVHVCRALGVPGMAATLLQLQQPSDAMQPM